MSHLCDKRKVHTLDSYLSRGCLSLTICRLWKARGISNQKKKKKKLAKKNLTLVILIYMGLNRIGGQT